MPISCPSLAHSLSLHPGERGVERERRLVHRVARPPEQPEEKTDKKAKDGQKEAPTENKDGAEKPKGDAVENQQEAIQRAVDTALAKRDAEKGEKSRTLHDNLSDIGKDTKGSILKLLGPAAFPVIGVPLIAGKEIVSGIKNKQGPIQIGKNILKTPFEGAASTLKLGFLHPFNTAKWAVGKGFNAVKSVAVPPFRWAKDAFMWAARPTWNFATRVYTRAENLVIALAKKYADAFVAHPIWTSVATGAVVGGALPLLTNAVVNVAQGFGLTLEALSKLLLGWAT